MTTRDEPGCLVQGLWFIFVGSWAGALMASLAWLLNITIIGLPLGMALLNNLPKVLALQSPEKRLKVIKGGSFETVIQTDQEQQPFIIRAIYFALVGWWWSAIWMSLAYLACATIILMPLGLGMFRSVPAMTTLRRY